MILLIFLCPKKPFEKVLGRVLKASGPSAWWVGCDPFSTGDGITQNHTVQLPVEVQPSL